MFFYGNYAKTGNVVLITKNRAAADRHWTLKIWRKKILSTIQLYVEKRVKTYPFNL